MAISWGEIMAVIFDQKTPIFERSTKAIGKKKDLLFLNLDAWVRWSSRWSALTDLLVLQFTRKLAAKIIHYYFRLFIYVWGSSFIVSKWMNQLHFRPTKYRWSCWPFVSLNVRQFLLINIRWKTQVIMDLSERKTKMLVTKKRKRKPPWHWYVPVRSII